MKKVLLTLIMVSLLSTTASAFYFESEQDCGSQSETGETRRHSHCYDDKDTDTNTHREKPKWGKAAGVEVPLWKHENFDIVSKNSYDFANENGMSAIVLEIKSDTGLIQKFFGMFKRGE